MISSWLIYVDGEAYCGEVEESEENKPSHGTGWNGRSPKNRSKILIKGKDALKIIGNTNLKSHLMRVFERLDRGITANEIKIIRYEQKK